MKVLHYVNEGHLAWAKPWMQLLDALRDLGVENVIMCPEKGPLTTMAKANKFETKNFTPPVSWIPSISFKAKKIIDEVDPDLIHTRLSSAAAIGGYWGRKCKVPVLATIDKYPKVKYYRNVSHLVGCSRAVTEHIVNAGIPPDKVSTIHNPILYDRYKKDLETRDKLRKEEGILPNNSVILGAGRFVDWKAFDVLLSSVSKLKDMNNWTLWLVGDGPERKKLVSMVKDLGLTERVKFWGFASDVRPFLWASDLFIQPSNKPEGFSLMLLEAMAAELPVIATSIGGTLDIVDEGENGWMVGPNDVKGLASLIRQALESENLRNLGENASLKASLFSSDRIASDYYDLYSRLTGKDT